MLHRLCLFALAVALAVPAEGIAQTRVRTETIRPPAAPQAPATRPETPAAKPDARAAAARQSPQAALPDVITDLSRLPAPVARTRERILAAAQSGDLQKLVTVMQTGETMPIFSFANDRDPVAYWKANYPDSDGIEALAILVTVLQTGFVHVDVGTPQEMYVWPYFARMPLKALKPEQKVELFRIVTGSDYKDMLDFGAYNFYRVGISPDGTWQYFVAGD